VSKKKKIIMVAVAVTVALAVGVGGLVYAGNGFPFPFDHEDVGGNKLIGVGEMGYDDYMGPYWDQDQWWDTQFIVTNPNCEQELTIEWVALIAGEDVYPYDDGDGPVWYAEDVIFEGTPGDWYDYAGIMIPGNANSEPGVLSPHEVWQVSIAELIAGVEDGPPPEILPDYYYLSKYTLEITWSGAYYSWWWHWGRVRPLTGWQKEKCVSDFFGEQMYYDFAISEAEMKNFESRTPFSLPGWWYSWWWANGLI